MSEHTERLDAAVLDTIIVRWARVNPDLDLAYEIVDSADPSVGIMDDNCAIDTSEYAITPTDAEAICKAPNDIARLLSECRALAAELDAANGRIAEIEGSCNIWAETAAAYMRQRDKLQLDFNVYRMGGFDRELSVRGTTADLERIDDTPAIEPNPNPNTTSF